MRKGFYCLMGIALLVSCRGTQTQVERIIEDGIEVVLNHIEPYSLPGVPSTLALEEIFTIDTEREEIVKTGLTSMEWFCLDREGDIYLMMRRTSENFIYKFDAAGKFVKSFGRAGQGPGEFFRGGNILCDGAGRLIAKDMTKTKYFVFTPDGAFVEEVELGKYLEILKDLGNKTFLLFWQDRDPVNPVYRNHYGIGDPALRSNHEFYEYEFDDPQRSVRYVHSGSAIILGASDENIFVGDSRSGYVIRVFDFSGKLVRKIRKDYRPVPLTDSYKNAVRKSQERRGTPGQEILRKLSFPAHLPPFGYLFTDSEGRLFVMTNEHEGERSYWYDIFTKEGVFIGRCRLGNLQLDLFDGVPLHIEPLDAQVKDDRLYCLCEKDNGYIMLTVYRMKWS
ncbi:MAG: 6-bladed beta-propeller [Candidatus Aminicenantes bacterium]|nr:6-bladed beta-propeller [Candidatus Aminicenantes bacterium]